MSRVSIPYRYDKNGGKSSFSSSSNQVSIPYRYDKNEHIQKSCIAYLAVSIPYRYDKNPDGNNSNKINKKFQFLIGTIKTDCFCRPPMGGDGGFNSL